MIQFEKRMSEGALEAADAIRQVCGIEPVAAQLLCVRGYDTVEKAKAFLNPSFDQLLDPYLFEDMQDAMDCLFAARSMEEIICVYGDYDADGISATAILLDYLRKEGFRATGYIPTRHGEGYGLNREAIDKLAAKDVSLIITVDCGITALDEIAYAQERGMEVIVTDHHQCLDTLPECAAIINPQASQYPNKALCGAGVVCKIVQAMGGLDAIKPYLDIAALATVADIVPLMGENRALVALGLARIRSGLACVGLKALISVSGLEERTLSAQNMAYGLAPRINAAGRLGSPRAGLELLISPSAEMAEKTAKELNRQNQLRKEEEAAIYEQAVSRIESGEVDLLHDSAILLADPLWNPGLIGIVAAKLVRQYHKPVLLFAGEADGFVASGRSIEGIHLFRALHVFEDCFERYGGHAMAAGLSMKEEKFSGFKISFLQYLQNEIPKTCYIPRVYYDLEADMNDLTLSLAQALDALAPFGTGNPQPTFCIRHADMENVRTMGNDHTHLKMQCGKMDVVAFGCGHELLKAQNHSLTVMGTLETNQWRGKTSLQFLVRAMQAEMDGHIPEFIEKNEWKFLDALCRRIQYSQGTEAMDRMSGEQGRERIAAYLAESPQGTLLACSTPQGAQEALTWLFENGRLEQMDIAWGHVQDRRAYNTLLLAPAPNAAWKPVCFDRVMWWDGGQENVGMGDYGKMMANVHIHMGEGLERFFHHPLITREQLIPVYRAMNAMAAQKQEFLDLEAYLQAMQTICKASKHEICAAIHIFSELGFFQLDEKGKFDLQAVKEPEKRDLMQSRIFAFLANAKA